MKTYRTFFFLCIVTWILMPGYAVSQYATVFPAKSEIVGIATPVTLNQDSTVIFLEDYFADVSLIDSVVSEKCFSANLAKDKKQVCIINKDYVPALSELKIWTGKTHYSLLLKKSERLKVTVTFNPRGKDYKTVQLAADFNGWNPASTAMTYAGAVWGTELSINPGTYYYQIVLDGKWMLDPANPDSADNNIGGFNSVLKAFNPAIDSRPQLYSLNASGNKLTIGKKNEIGKLFVFWQNFSVPEMMIRNMPDMTEIEIPKEAGALERSFIRIYACNDAGRSNDLLIPLRYGEVVLDAGNINRFDKEGQVIYFLMVDRFFDQDTANDRPVKDAKVSPKANFMGGDITGIQTKIDDGYFTDLGINMLWISPLNQNPEKAYKEYPAPHRKFSGYHGYWPVSSTRTDKRFGTEAELKDMVKAAHSKEINVILDYVANHVHIDHPLWKQHPEWFTSMYLPDGRKNLRLFDEYRLTTWFDTFLPKFDFSKPEVVASMTDSALYWIKTYDLDGFRHDATKHITEFYQRELTKKIKKEISVPQNKSFYQIGETYGSRELVGSYVNSGELDAQFDFNLYFDLRSALINKNESFEKLGNSLQESINNYGCHNLMGNITGNHDIGRFISYADGSLSSQEDDKKAGWSRYIEAKDPAGYKKLSMLTAYIMTIPGIPVIYYGDEIGMPGAGDPDNRRMMKFDKLSSYEKETKDIASKLIKLRRSNMSLMYGDYKAVNISKDTYAFIRSYFGEIAVVVLNKSEKNEKISFEIPERFSNQVLKSNFGASFNKSGRSIEIMLPGNTFEILTN